ncbi:MAG: FMN-binding negative transcriptional regulator, partial [Elsteraceae bacterium]
MYQPPHFREDRLEVQQALIEARSLGMLITAGPEGIDANPIPFILDRAASKLGTLRAHLAKANPQWRLFTGDREALVVFQEVDRYVSPSWYPSKREHGKVVPTWNYAMVQVWGKPRLMATGEDLRAQLDALTHRHESARAHPWKVDDAPADFIAAQMKGIVGVEIEIERIEGKWKVSQNRQEL